jgi:hypothetical protein
MPLKPIKRDPFAVLNATTVEEDDSAPIPRNRKGKSVKNLIVKYRSGHKW